MRGWGSDPAEALGIFLQRAVKFLQFNYFYSMLRKEEVQALVQQLLQRAVLPRGAEALFCGDRVTEEREERD